ncbi:MAG TPA: tryptophan synthase subunit alpha [Syntrophales bacterium]
MLEEHLRIRLSGGRKLLVPFLTAGFPDEAGFLTAARAAGNVGADAIEVGIPFSDPLADGPTIQRTSQRALDGGANLREILHSLFHHHLSIRAPVVLMSYLNPIHAMGIDAFSEEASEAGVAGILVSDLPPDEDADFTTKLHAHGIDRIILVAPTTGPSRINTLVDAGSGYIYLVTRTGVTGAGGAFSRRLAEQVGRIRDRSNLPVIAGFGIRSVTDVEAVKSFADGVVIGARLLEVIEEAANAGDPSGALVRIDAAVKGFLGPIREALGH